MVNITFKDFIIKIIKFVICIVVIWLLLEAAEFDDRVFYPLFLLALYAWLSVVHREDEGPRMYKFFTYSNRFFIWLFKFVIFMVVYFTITMSYLNFLDMLVKKFVLAGELMAFFQSDPLLYQIYFILVCWMSLCLTFHACHRNSAIYDALKRINLAVYHYVRFALFFRFFTYNIIFFIESPFIPLNFAGVSLSSIFNNKFIHPFFLSVVYYISLRFTLHVNRHIFPRLNIYTAKLTSVFIKLIKFSVIWLFLIRSISYITKKLEITSYVYKFINMGPSSSNPILFGIMFFIILLSFCFTVHIRKSVHPSFYKYFKHVNRIVFKFTLFSIVSICFILVVYSQLHIYGLLEPPFYEYAIDRIKNGEAFGPHGSHGSIRSLQVFRLVVHYLHHIDFHGSIGSLRVFYSEACFMLGKDFPHETGAQTLKIFRLEVNSFLSKYFHGSTDAIDVLVSEAHRYVIRDLHGSDATLGVFKKEALRISLKHK